jgi:hypothetical protein
MSQQQTRIADELGKMQHEPLLPVEKKLITWSLGIGIALLVLLAFMRHIFM